MNIRSLLLVGLAFLAIALFVQAPAASVYAWLKPKDRPLPVELFGLEGRVIEGRSSGVVRNGNTLVSNLNWELHPLQLLIGRAALSLHSEHEPVLLDGGVSVSPLGTLRVKSLRASGGLRALAAAAGYPFVPVEGQVGLDLAQLRMAKGQIQLAEGSAQLQGLAWALGAQPTPLGDFRADVTTEDGSIVVQLASVSGPLELSGEARLAPDQNYELNVRMRPKPGAPPMLPNLLMQLGAPDAQGYYTLRRQGLMPGAQPPVPAP
ncbi:type II secretion system protein N [Solimonas sp. K1W22B-7]|uniref:type II secretion system protein N n=1 Tax=Solimonas sp. K1W22B-7 TaxID=2303331 RepID=UPI000E3371E4|nr:type II secretion system protein N [Solimonas sp. K1W22B-7]AXQ29447.1 type II secretion system protein N [Solimonas sp. K1W22B-7]